MSSILHHDNRDDRREIHYLLSKLSPHKRIAWVQKCCRKATLRGSVLNPAVDIKSIRLAELAMRDDSADQKLTMDLFLDLWHLANHYNFDLEAALVDLERVVKSINPRHTQATSF